MCASASSSALLRENVCCGQTLSISEHHGCGNLRAVLRRMKQRIDAGTSKMVSFFIREWWTRGEFQNAKKIGAEIPGYSLLIFCIPRQTALSFRLTES